MYFVHLFNETKPFIYNVSVECNSKLDVLFKQNLIMKPFSMALPLLVNLVVVTLRDIVINGVVGHLFKSIEC